MGLIEWFTNFFDKNSAATDTKIFSGGNAPGGAIESETMSSQQLAEELHRSIFRKLKKIIKIALFLKTTFELQI